MFNDDKLDSSFQDLEEGMALPIIPSLQHWAWSCKECINMKTENLKKDTNPNLHSQLTWLGMKKISSLVEEPPQLKAAGVGKVSFLQRSVGH